MYGNTLHFFVGFGTGFTYFSGKQTEDEIKQGKHYYLAALNQIIEAVAVSTLLSTFAELNPGSRFKRTAKIFSNVAPFVCIPMHLFFASVKHEHYENIAHVLNFITRLPIPIQEKLGKGTTKVINFLAENSGNIYQVAMVAASIFFLISETPFVGAGVLTALSIHFIDQKGWLPRKAGLFLETYLEVPSLLGSMVYASSVMRIITVAYLILNVLGSKNPFFIQQLDVLLSKFWKQKGPSLRSIDAPVKIDRELSYEKIIEILNKDRGNYQINPAIVLNKCMDFLNFQKIETLTNF